jgi:hypothetical protein
MHSRSEDRIPRTKKVLILSTGLQGKPKHAVEQKNKTQVVQSLTEGVAPAVHDWGGEPRTISTSLLWPYGACLSGLACLGHETNALPTSSQSPPRWGCWKQRPLMLCCSLLSLVRIRVPGDVPACGSNNTPDLDTSEKTGVYIGATAGACGGYFV